MRTGISIKLPAGLLDSSAATATSLLLREREIGAGSQPVETRSMALRVLASRLPDNNIYMHKLLQTLGIIKHRHNWMPTGKGQMMMCVECRLKGRIY
jgi:hypothetical protein